MSSPGSSKSKLGVKRKRGSWTSNANVGAKTSTTTFSSTDKDKPLAANNSLSGNPVFRVRPAEIKNKIKRTQLHQKQKAEKKKAKSQEKQKRRKLEAEGLGEEKRPEKKQRTLDNTREADETLIEGADAEVEGDEAQDEFSSYFNAEVEPKIILTTCYKPTKHMYDFIRDLLHVFPNSFYYERQRFHMKTIVKVAIEKGFTDLIVINEDKKKFNGLTHIHLPGGPTAYYKLSSVRLCRDLPGHGTPTEHRPEVIVNRFNTRLGHRVSRMLSSLFHQKPEFRGRRVVTFHNQRDFIFFRHHRYVFESRQKARLQELGPRFTLKLRWLQQGTFDTKHGEFEWVHKPDMDTSRRKFYL